MSVFDSGLKLARIAAGWRGAYFAFVGSVIGSAFVGAVAWYAVLIALCLSAAAGAWTYWREGRKQADLSIGRSD